MKLKDVKLNGGATLNKAGEMLDFARGYQVSVCDLEVIPVRALRKSHLNVLLGTLSADECLGVWIEKGKVYIDKSQRFTNKRVALAFGRAHKQISIFNWKEKNCIYC